MTFLCHMLYELVCLNVHAECFKLCHFFSLLQCRLRGKVDSNGVVAAFLEERLNMGLNFILSAEVRI